MHLKTTKLAVHNKSQISQLRNLYFVFENNKNAAMHAAIFGGGKNVVILDRKSILHRRTLTPSEFWGLGSGTQSLKPYPTFNLIFALHVPTKTLFDGGRL